MYLLEYSFDGLMASLLAYEDRLNRSQERSKETTFQVKGESFFNKGKSKNFASRGKGKGGFRCQGQGRGRSRNQYREQKQFKSNI